MTTNVNMRADPERFFLTNVQFHEPARKGSAFE
jgi:hypothetical protein